jgi:GNAT superfamily N-acetyltransferase
LSAARPAQPEEAEALARMLARAFLDDPVMEWLYPSERGREARIRRYFRVRVRQLLRHGEVWTTPARSGTAAWARPGDWQMGLLQTLELAPMAASLGTRLPRILTGLARTEKHHPREPEHWYLAILGTEPSTQGEGVGTQVLAPVLEACDRDGVPAYLESSKERNVDYYARFGFRVREELRLPKGPRLWAMWRDPLG